MAAPARPAEPHLGELGPKAAAALVREHIDPTDIRQFLRSSPARLMVMGLVLIAACLVAGAVTASTVSERQQTLDRLLAQTEPFASSSQRLYSSLSIADASAATGFIAGGIEPKEVRDRYNQAIGDAAAELAGGAAGTDDAQTQTRTLLTGIATQLPVYTGLIETARANNRSGHPVGATYLAQASNLMQTKMLPMAEALHAQQSAAVVETQQRYARSPWAPIILLLLTLLLLILVQVYLARKWRRLLNFGLIAATFVIVALLAWLVAAGSISAVATHRALYHGTHPVENLTDARILAQQARSDETLRLASRDTSGEYDREYDKDMGNLVETLDDYADDVPGAEDVGLAQAALDRWGRSHRQMNDTLAVGNFDGASVVAIGPGEYGSAAQFTALDAALDDGIAAARTELRTNAFQASRALAGLPGGALTLGIIAGCLAVAGLWPRVREYR